MKVFLRALLLGTGVFSILFPLSAQTYKLADENIVPPSPTSTVYQQYAGWTPDLSTGAATLSFPLYDVVTDYVGNAVYTGSTLSMLQIPNGYVTFSGTSPTYHYYQKDHLGSNRMVTGASGTVEQVVHYYPFGGQFADGTAASLQEFKFTGKEWDSSKGQNLYDFGARTYDPALLRWTTPDPLSSKYPAWSPYAYCGNSPVLFVDPDGKIILIRGIDKNGNSFDYVYSPGSNYSGDDRFIKNVIKALNTISSLGGKDIISLLVNSSSTYTYLNDYYKYKDYLVGGFFEGNLFLAPYFNEDDDASHLEGVAHESFHALQDDLGQGGKSDINEVEAYTFAGRIINNYSTRYGLIVAGAPGTRGKDTTRGKLYEDAMNQLIYGTSFDRDAFYHAVKNFHRGSDTDNLYDSFPIRTSNYKSILINKFWPQTIDQ